MKKVLYVFGGEKASGAEIVIERLMKNNQDEVESHLFIAPGNFAHNLQQLNKPYKITIVDQLKKLNRSSSGALSFYLKALSNYFVISYMVYKYIMRYEIKVVHANTIVPASYLLPTIIFSKIFSKKITWIWTDHDLKYYSALDNKLSKLCAKFYSITFVVSNAVKSKYKKSGKIEILYNGLEENSFSENLSLREIFRIENSIINSQLVFLIAGAIGPRKGQLLLINVFKKLYVKYSNIILFIAGRFGEDDHDYNQKVRDELVNVNYIQYIGMVDEMNKLYNGCDIVLNNSNIEGSEPLGTSIYEAMACGKVVVASRTGGTEEIISHGEDGFIFEPENEESLFNQLEQIIINFSELGNIKQQAKVKVSQKFNILTMKNKYNNFIAGRCIK